MRPLSPEEIKQLGLEEETPADAKALRPLSAEEVQQLGLEPPPAESPHPSVGDTLVRSFGNSGSLGLGNYAGAGLQALAAAVTPGMRAGETFKQALSENRELSAADAQDNPWTNAVGGTAGMVAGAVANPLVRIPAAAAFGKAAQVATKLGGGTAANMATRAAAGSLVGGGLGATQTALAGGNAEQVNSALGGGMLLGGAGAAAPLTTAAMLTARGVLNKDPNQVVGGAAMAVPGFAQWLATKGVQAAPALRSTANEAAARVVRPGAAAIAKMGGRDAMQAMGRQLLEEKLIERGDTPETVAPKIVDRSNQVGQEIGQWLQGLQEQVQRQAPEVLPFDQPAPRQLDLAVSGRPPPPRLISTNLKPPMQQGAMELAPGAQAATVPPDSVPREAMTFPNLPVQEVADIIPGLRGGQVPVKVYGDRYLVPPAGPLQRIRDAAYTVPPAGTQMRALQEALPGMEPARPSMGYPAPTPPVQSATPEGPPAPTGTSMSPVQDTLPGTARPSPRMDYPAPVPAPLVSRPIEAPPVSQTSFLKPGLNPFEQRLTPAAIADRVRADVGSRLTDTAALRDALPALENQLGNIRALGDKPLTVPGLTAQKAAYGRIAAKANAFGNNDAPRGEMLEALYHSLKNQEESLGSDLAQKAGPEAFAQWLKNKSRYQNLERAEQAALRADTRDLANRRMSLTDTLAFLKNPVMGAANHALRTQGDAALALAADGFARSAESGAMSKVAQGAPAVNSTTAADAFRRWLESRHGRSK
jgi:hypothetical protein